MWPLLTPAAPLSALCVPELQVPYHPVVAYLWGAHTNIQVVTNAAWSFYMLKYALKVGQQRIVNWPESQPC